MNFLTVTIIYVFTSYFPQIDRDLFMFVRTLAFVPRFLLLRYSFHSVSIFTFSYSSAVVTSKGPKLSCALALCCLTYLPIRFTSNGAVGYEF